jgi:hypothetical protein
MLGIPIRYFFKNPVSTFATLAADPLQVCLNLQDSFVAERELRKPMYRYSFDDCWEQRLHESLAAPWTCDHTAEFSAVWSQIESDLKAKGIDAGPESFQYWNDGDGAFTRAVWCLIRHLRPAKVVETGVAHGVTSRCILEALEKNQHGHLWSIDLPPIEKFWRQHTGAAVGGRFADRWTYIAGSSRRRLPGLLSQLGQIDLFIHDSLHSERNVRFEVDRACAALGPRGAIVVDDIDANWGFRSFTLAYPKLQTLIGESEPLRPDLRRFNEKGLFGIILKQPNPEA